MKTRLDAAGGPTRTRRCARRPVRPFTTASTFRLRDLTSRARQQQLKADFETYLDGFSPNVLEVLERFKFRNQIPELVENDLLGFLLEKFLDPSINLSPKPVLNADGSVRLEALDNHGMGTVFEELIRRFNEENNEEAGEHFTPRDVVQLMARLIFIPVADEVKSGIRDSRFIVEHDDDPEHSLITRSSDVQMMFLANMLSKMKQDTPLGSRIAEVHNGSSLFTGDAGQGESNIRRWIIENDWFEAIVALPLNMFYNTGIATCIWVLSNRKPEHRRGKVQLIDATQWSKPLRKNLGNKNCELSDEDLARICNSFLTFEENEQSKIFPTDAFGYWKVTVDRPLRLSVDLSPDHRERFRTACHDAKEEPLAVVVERVAAVLGDGPHSEFNQFLDVVAKYAHECGVKLTTGRKKLLQTALASRDEAAEPIKKKIHRPGNVDPDPIRDRVETTMDGRHCIVEYEHDSELRDTEQVPLLKEGGIENFLRREVTPSASDAWYDPASVKIGYEISFTRYFYKPQPMRTLEEIRADILALERETEGLLGEILGQ